MPPSGANTTPGTVYLVGAGPGDPNLITVRGKRLIAEADVILYDNLSPVCLLEDTRPDARRIYVGKKRAEHVHTQAEINALLIAEARTGHRVVRLKGGDPFIFGRGGEEAEVLAEAGIPFEVIPGVTSAVGVAAYAGIPLTHRRETSEVSFVTGHDVEAIDWSKYRTGTLVIFMGLTTFGDIARRLIATGRSPETPAAAVRWGTRGDQLTVQAPLSQLAAKVKQAKLRPPALVVVGEVVALRSQLNWFERLPLFGQRIVVTRPRDQAAALTDRLRALGAEAISLPTIEIRPPDDWTPLDEAISRLDTYDWLIFTSANGVNKFIERLDQSPSDLRCLRARICAIGPATAEALSTLHLKVDRLPAEYVAESLLQAFAGDDLNGKRILLPRALVARDLIPAQLEQRGARVDVVAAYQTVIPAAAAPHAQRLFAAPRRPDWITFTSSSTVKNFLSVCPKENLEAVRVASIGPITSGTARELGLSVDQEASRYTIDGLIEAILSADKE
jgi:uroporphyrinogen III methyltransferase/synthase